jgi:hypothetical protein
MVIYILASILNSTGRPVVFYMLPDLPPPATKFLKPKKVMEAMAEWKFKCSKEGLLPEKASITMDALFSYSDILKEWLAFGISGSIGLKTDALPIAALSHNLPRGSSRIFQDGNVLITVYRDNKLMGTASTVFNVQEERIFIAEMPLMNLYSSDFLHLLYFATSIPQIKNDIILLTEMCGIATSSQAGLDLISALSHNTKENLEAILSDYPPSQELIEKISAHFQINEDSDSEDSTDHKPKKILKKLERRRSEKGSTQKQSNDKEK